MKKIIVMAFMLSTFAVSAFATDNTGVNEKALSAFSKSFKYAENVKWEIQSNLYKATFNSGGKVMFAYYNAEGEQLALSRNISLEQLPLALATELTSKFDNSWLTELFEVSVNGETSYYATIENATHTITLKADGTGGWSTLSKEKKK